mgnify:FL=1
MKRRKLHNYILINLLLCLFLSIGIHKLQETGGFLRLNENTITKDAFRRQKLNEEILSCARDTKDPGKNLGLYLLETNFGGKTLKNPIDPGIFQRLENKWARREYFDDYTAQCRSIWNDLVYFPVPEPSNNVSAGVSYVDSWMFERNYGGKRGHEGTDIMANKNQRGFYPIVSMTDGVVRHKGWLEQGGWRLGIVSPGGAYFYYAHMDSYADIEVGDTIKAGDLLGYMGDTGYSTVEGTTGNFPVHLHVGIYLFHREEEVSVNPYWALRYIENQKIKCAYSQ